MQQSATISDKQLNIAGLAVLFLGVAAFAYSGSYFMLAIPIGFLFVITMGLNWKLVYWILLFSIPASVQLEFMSDTLSTSLPDEPIMWMFFLLFLFMWARQPNMIPRWWWSNPIIVLILLQYLWMTVAVIYSHEPFLSVKWMLAKSWYLVSFLVLPLFVFTEKKDFRKGFILFIIPTMITIIIINIRHAALGFHFRKVEKAINPIYINHVDYSTVLSMVFPMLVIAVILTRGKSWLLRLTVLALCLFMLPAIYLTFARAAMVAVVFCITVAIAIRMRLVNLIMPAIYGIVALMMVFVTDNNHYINYRPNYTKTFMRAKFEDHIIATIRGQDMSSMERLYRWIAAVRMSKDEPLVGYGPNAFYYYYKPYAVSSFRTYVSRNEEHSTTHNYYLYMLVEQGWPAMIIYAIFVFVYFSQAQKIYHRFKNRDRFYKYCTLGMAMVFAACFVNNFFSELLESHKIGSLFYLVIGLTVILDKKSRDMEKEELENASTNPQ
ncbi:MAG: O-antigen ligase family protein [Sphingobacteriales bacterium]|nr:MAG: O-antigen ligase family protein [Sphingobacteriales bacterium]